MHRETERYETVRSTAFFALFRCVLQHMHFWIIHSTDPFQNRFMFSLSLSLCLSGLFFLCLAPLYYAFYPRRNERSQCNLQKKNRLPTHHCQMDCASSLALRGFLFFLLLNFVFFSPCCPNSFFFFLLLKFFPVNQFICCNFFLFLQN